MHAGLTFPAFRCIFLSLYKMTENELLSLVSVWLKHPLTKNDILSNQINLSHLKRIDKYLTKSTLLFRTEIPGCIPRCQYFFQKSKVLING